MIRAAQEALGEGRADDYRIQPTQHAEELANKAPVLAAALENPDLLYFSKRYEEKDQQARENQARFRNIVNRANWAVLLTACFSTLLLIVGPMKSVGGLPLPVAMAIIGSCGVISGAVGSMWVYQAREGKLLDNWMSARAEAETLRKQYFETITGLELTDNSSAIAPALLQFEYFRRFQLDVQVSFYQRRSADHRKNADRFLQVSAYSVALGSISAGLAAILTGLSPAWASIAALGTVATALSAFAANRETVNQSRQNLDRYTKAYEALTTLKRKLDAVRAAAITGEREPITQFVAAAHEQITAEHRQWLAAAQSVQPALDKLDESLAKLKPKAKEAKS